MGSVGDPISQKNYGPFYIKQMQRLKMSYAIDIGDDIGDSFSFSIRDWHKNVTNIEIVSQTLKNVTKIKSTTSIFQ